MILSPALAEKATILAETSDDLLPLFPPMERAVILALRGLMRSKRNSPIAVGQHSEHQMIRGTYE
jgi:hypothetical protein